MAEDSNITINSGFDEDFSSKRFKRATWFEAYDVGGSTGASYEYNDSQEADDEAGVVEVRRFDQKKTIIIGIPTLGSTSIDVRIEGRIGGRWGEIVTLNFDSALLIDHIVNVVEQIDDVRVGVKANTPGTDAVTIRGAFLGSQR